MNQDLLKITLVRWKEPVLTVQWSAYLEGVNDRFDGRTKEEALLGLLNSLK